MMKKLFCEKCNKECACEMQQEKEVYPVKGEDTTILAKISYCSKCGEKVWDPVFDEENINVAFSQYREKHRLLQPEEIKSIREKYHLSQVSFGRILGLGDKTIARYETGSIQDLAPNNLILLAEDPDNFELLLERNPSILSDTERTKVLQIISKLKSESTVTIEYGSQKTSYEISKSFISSFGVRI